MSDYLKPCPRCGNPAITIIPDFQYDGLWQASCMMCDTRTLMCATREEAIWAWNGGQLSLRQEKEGEKRMNEYIKPCPSCGCDEPEVIGDKDVFSVCCPIFGCLLSGPMRETRESAIKAWNNLTYCLHWTKEKPDSPGWYWYNPGADYEPYIVRVVRGSIDGRLYVMCDGLSTMDGMCGLWSGEIENPIEGEV